MPQLAKALFTLIFHPVKTTKHPPRQALFPIVPLIIALALSLCISARSAEKSNVLFIAIDDLNDWVGVLDDHPQVQTPNIDRLATRGVNFTNAHCQAPICMPSRASLLTGTYPHRNGIYMIEQNLHEAPLLKNVTTLPSYFKQNGYRILRSGKIYHRVKEGDADDWDESGKRYGWGWMGKLAGPQGVSGLPEPSIFDFGPIPVKTAEMNDSKVTDWAVERIT